MSETLELGQHPNLPAAFSEGPCIIELNGMKFTSGGAHIWPCKDGRYHGLVYFKLGTNGGLHTVSTWSGKILATASRSDYRGNFCKMRRVSFTLAGIKFVGDYCPDWADCVRVRSTKKQDFSFLERS